MMIKTFELMSRNELQPVLAIKEGHKLGGGIYVFIFYVHICQSLI